MTDVLLTNYLSAVWAPCYHLLSPAPTFILHLHKTDSASTSEYLKVPQGTSWYIEVLQSTHFYSQAQLDLHKRECKMLLNLLSLVNHSPNLKLIKSEDKNNS